MNNNPPSSYGDMTSVEDLKKQLEELRAQYQEALLENVELKVRVKHLTSQYPEVKSRAIYLQGREDGVQQCHNAVEQILFEMDQEAPVENLGKFPGRWLVQMAANAFPTFFRSKGAKNFVSCHFVDAGGVGTFQVLIQRTEGITPGQLIKELMEKNTELEAKYKTALSELEESENSLSKANEQVAHMSGEMHGNDVKSEEAAVIRHNIITYFQTQGRGTASARAANEFAVTQLVDAIPELKEIT